MEILHPSAAPAEEQCGGSRRLFLIEFESNREREGRARFLARSRQNSFLHGSPSFRADAARPPDVFRFVSGLRGRLICGAAAQPPIRCVSKVIAERVGKSNATSISTIYYLQLLTWCGQKKPAEAFPRRAFMLVTPAGL